MVKVEIALNTLGDGWWFNLGIGYEKVDLIKWKYVMTLELIFFTVYFRW